MQIPIYKNSLYLVLLFLALIWLGGCSGLAQYAPAEAPKLTAVEKARIGAAVEEKLIQLLGGPYYDVTLIRDLSRFVPSDQTLKVSVADRSASAIYPLPDGRVVLTRGLLSEVRSRAELESLLVYAVRLSNNVYEGHITHSMAEATEAFLSASSHRYDPESAEIRLARLFEQDPCEQSCLAPFRSVGVESGKADSAALPDSIVRLSKLQSGYELLAEGQKLEKLDDQAKAIATYLQAAATTPDEPRILGTLGLAYLRAGQMQPARLHLQKSVKIQPEYYRTRMGLGYLYLQLGQISQANDALASSARMLPVTENLFLLAEAREKSGDIDGAMLLYRLIVESDQNSKLGRTAAGRLARPATVQ
ncbi:MAG: tetratricopeptide repeat protein [Desulfuromonadales bacterium]